MINITFFRLELDYNSSRMMLYEVLCLRLLEITWCVDTITLASRTDTSERKMMTYLA